MKIPILALSLALVGCSDPPPPAPGDGPAAPAPGPADPGVTAPQGDGTASADATAAAVTRAIADPAAFGALAARIQAEPAKADAILQEAGMTRADFDAAVYAIASEPDAAEAFQAALD